MMQKGPPSRAAVPEIASGSCRRFEVFGVEAGPSGLRGDHLRDTACSDEVATHHVGLTLLSWRFQMFKGLIPTAARALGF